MNVFVIVLIITALFAEIFKDDKKRFIISTSLVHILVCGFRHESVHGDLMAYKRGFLECANVAWNSDRLISNGRNTLFYMLNKLISTLTNNNYQVLLFVITTVSIAALGYTIYKYSEMPFVSFFVWNCFGYYIFNCYSIKQSLAMAFVLFASIGIFEKKRLFFYLCTIIAGFIHLPAFVFLPAYELCKARKLRTIVYFYVIVAVTIVLFRNQIVSNMSDLYYEGDKYQQISSYAVGGRTILYILLLIAGLFLCNIKHEKFRYVFILIASASLLQMFSVYDNVFTRLADYYFQFIILYAPFILKQPYSKTEEMPYMVFNEDSKKLMTIAFLCLAFVFYYRVDLLGRNVGWANNVVANFKFFWQ